MFTPALRSSNARSAPRTIACRLRTCCCKVRSEPGSLSDAVKLCSDSVIRLFRIQVRSGIGVGGTGSVGFEVERLQERVDGRVALAVFQRLDEQRLGNIQPALDLRHLRLYPSQIAR